MADHLWRWHGTEHNPYGWVYDGDGWYICLRCGWADRSPELKRAIPSHCPGWVGEEYMPGGTALDRAALRQVREAEPHVAKED